MNEVKNMDTFIKNKRYLMNHLGRLEVECRAFSFNSEDKPNYDEVINEAQEIIKIANFLKTYTKVHNEIQSNLNKEDEKC